jgi:hypothetical protein
MESKLKYDSDLLSEIYYIGQNKYAQQFLSKGWQVFSCLKTTPIKPNYIYDEIRNILN